MTYASFQNNPERITFMHNVGINTIDPTCALDIVGDVKWSGTLQGDASGLTGIPGWDLNPAQSNITMSPDYTKLGIGKTPSVALDVNGDVAATSISASGTVSCSNVTASGTVSCSAVSSTGAVSCTSVSCSAVSSAGDISLGIESDHPSHGHSGGWYYEAGTVYNLTAGVSTTIVLNRNWPNLRNGCYLVYMQVAASHYWVGIVTRLAGAFIGTHVWHSAGGASVNITEASTLQFHSGMVTNGSFHQVVRIHPIFII